MLEVFIVLVNYFKFKGGFGLGGNVDVNDGVGNWNECCIQVVEVFYKWLVMYLIGVSDDDILIIGDLNVYSMEDLIVELMFNGYINVMDGEVYYFYVFDGFVGNLDYGLVLVLFME